MEPGARVEVRSMFERSWSRGFEVVEVVEAGGELDTPGYRVRRRSDGEILPAVFPEDDVREEKKGRSMWWY